MRTNYLKRGLLLPLIAIMFLFSAGLTKAQIDSTGNEGQIWFENAYRSFSIERGEDFAYQYIANSDLEGEIRYSLEYGENPNDVNIPEGIEINAETGMVEWTPEQVGEYFFMVKAYMQNDPTIYTYCYNYVRVERPFERPCATITVIASAPEGYSEAELFQSLSVYAIPANASNDSLGYGQYFFGEPQGGGIYEIHVPQGSYSVYLTFGYNLLDNSAIPAGDANPYTIACEETLTLNKFLTVDELPDFITFTTNPENEEYNIGDVLTYDCDAVSSKGNEVRYALVKGPETATIDEMTGLVTWTADRPGYNHFGIVAYTPADSNNYNIQDWEVFVRRNVNPGERCVLVNGYITSANGQAINRAEVYAYRVDMDTVNGGYEEDAYFARAKTNGNGYYHMSLYPGTYVFAVSAEGSNIKYFENSIDFTNATLYTVACGDSLVLSTSMDSIPVPNMFTISGQVTDETTGEGLANVLVDFMPAAIEDGEIHLSDCGVNGYFSNTVTDDAGNFSIQLPENSSFVIYANVPRDGNYGYYIGEYYDNVYDYQNAQLITLTGDRSDINIALGSYNNNPLNGFGGSVRNTEGQGVRAMVTAIRIPAEEENMDYMFTNVATDSTGAYMFQNVPTGNYLVFAMPFNQPLLPGFYVAGANATWNWQEATVIGVGDVVLTVQHDITLVGIEGMQGPGRVHGRIHRHSAGLAFDGGSTIASEGVSNVNVTIFNKNNVPVKYTTTNTLGEFDMTNLGFGEFKVVASRVGYTNSQTTVTLNQESYDNSQTLYMDPIEGALDVNDDATLSSISIYPNPVTTTANVDFNANLGNAVITVSDMQGNVIMNLETATVQGINKVNFNVNNFANGVYVVRVSGNGADYKTLLNVVK